MIAFSRASRASMFSSTSKWGLTSSAMLSSLSSPIERAYSRSEQPSIAYPLYITAGYSVIP